MEVILTAWCWREVDESKVSLVIFYAVHKLEGTLPANL